VRRVGIAIDAADAARRSEHDGATAADVDEAPLTSRAPFLAVAAIVAAAFVAYALLGANVDSPRVFSDELLYFGAAAALEEGSGLSVRGEDYLYGPLYPALLAPMHWLADGRQGAYELAKALNALLFALAAVPVFLLARRLLRDWSAVAVAALAVAIPSASYVSVVMTESLAFLACSWAFYAVLLALERPTALRQLAALGAIALATGVRTQFAVLLAVYLLALALVTVIVPGRLARPRALATAYWPTWAAVAIGAVLAVDALTASGTGPLGGYSDVRRSYDPLEVGRWLAYHVANLELYVAVIPLAVAPIVLAAMFRRGRRGDERHAAFLALFLAANSVFLLVAAAFNSEEFAVGSLHDRVLFYVVPLWLVVLFAWIGDGAPKPALAAITGAALALVLPLLLPFSEYARDHARQQFNGVGTTLWATLDEATAGHGRLILVGVVVALVTVTLLARARARLLPMAVLAVFLLSSVLNWHLAGRVATLWAAVLPAEQRSWLDDNVRDGGTVTALVAIEECTDFAPRDSFYLTEFFNSSLARIAYLGTPHDSLPTEPARVEPDGAVVLASGAPLVSDYVLMQPGVDVEGRRVAEGTSARLALWETAGPVRLAGVGSTAELEAAVCPLA
jgi:hypothetical protein